MSGSRTNNSIKNIKFGFAAQFLRVALSFVIRYFLILYLGKQYLGINAAFSSILTFLSIAELGMGEAISFMLYKPLAEKNEASISRILYFLRKIYFFIFIFIISFGLISSFFLKYIIGDAINTEHIYLYFALFVANSACGFVFSYKTILLNADQKNYVVSFWTSICVIVGHILQIVFLMITKHFLAYLSFQIVMTLSVNICCAIYVNKHYLFLKKYKKEKLSKDETSIFKRNLSGLIMQKINAVVIQSIDVLILSSMFNVELSGVYSNYALIIGHATTFATLCFNSSLASVGNLIATKDRDYCISIYKKTQFLTLWLYLFCSIMIFGLMDKVILILADSSYLLPRYVLIILCLNFFIFGIRNNVVTFKNAYGLYRETRWLPLICSGLNIILSITFAKLFGYSGIFVATTIVYLIMLVRENFVLQKHGFKNSFNIFEENIKPLACFLVCGVFALCFSLSPVPNKYLSLIISTVFFIFAGNLIVWLILGQDREKVSYLLSTVKRFVGKLAFRKNKQ